MKNLTDHIGRTRRWMVIGLLLSLFVSSFNVAYGQTPRTVQETIDECSLDTIQKTIGGLDLSPEKVKKLLGELGKAGYSEVSQSSDLDEKVINALVSQCHKTRLFKVLSDFGILPDADSEATDEAAEEEPPSICVFNDIATTFTKRKSTNIDVNALQSLLIAHGFMTDSQDGILGTESFQGLERLCHYLEKNNLLADAKSEDMPTIQLFKDRLNSTKPDGKEFSELQLTAQKLTAQTTNIELDPAGCGCSGDFKASVYGFLPHWITMGIEQTVDLSNLNGIGFFALQLGNDGNIQNDSLLGNNPNTKKTESESRIARVITSSKKHRVKFDITYHMTEWQKWDEAIISKAATEISGSFLREFQDSSLEDDNFSLSRFLRKNMPFVEDYTTVGADGINLYFDNVGAKVEDQEKSKIWRQHAKSIVDFVKAVKLSVDEGLAGKDRKYRINIILGLGWKGIKEAAENGQNAELPGLDPTFFSDLTPIFGGKLLDVESEPLIQNMFIFLPRNTSSFPRITSYSKKLLRLSIEEAFDGSGALRKTVLDMTVPILSTEENEISPNYFNIRENDEDSKSTTGNEVNPKDNKKRGYFTEDLIYLEHNFKGVGLWPLPLQPKEKEGGNAEMIGKRLVEEYAIPNAVVAFSTEIEHTSPKISGIVLEFGKYIEQTCNFVCPNRWKFRIVFDVLLGLAVFFALLYPWKCRLREIFKQRTGLFFGYGSITFFSWALLAICDPFTKDQARYVPWIMLFIVFVFGVWKYIESRRDPLP